VAAALAVRRTAACCSSPCLLPDLYSLQQFAFLLAFPACYQTEDGGPEAAAGAGQSEEEDE
jgi:hypothetical protein